MLVALGRGVGWPRKGILVFETDSIDRSTADLITAVDGKPIRTIDDFESGDADRWSNF